MWDVMKSRWKWFGMTLLAAVLSSMVFTLWLLPRNLYQLTPSQISLMNTSANFTVVWNHLSKAEQKCWIDKLTAVREKQYQQQANNS